MKKWISYLLLPVILIAAFPFSMAGAEETCSGKLTANGNQINVSLSVPQDAAEKITSLHFRIDVSISSGGMDEPVFQFADTIQSEVKDSKVIKNNDSYIVDVILSGKKDQIIFPADGQAAIGTVSLKPSGSVYKISTKFTGMTDEKPAMEYVNNRKKFPGAVLLFRRGRDTGPNKGTGCPDISFGNAVKYRPAGCFPISVPVLGSISVSVRYAGCNRETRRF